MATNDIINFLIGDVKTTAKRALGENRLDVFEYLGQVTSLYSQIVGRMTTEDYAGYIQSVYIFDWFRSKWPLNNEQLAHLMAVNARNGNLALVIHIHNIGVTEDFKMNALGCAVQGTSGDVVEFLLDNRADYDMSKDDINTSCVWGWAIQNNHPSSKTLAVLWKHSVDKNKTFRTIVHDGYMQRYSFTQFLNIHKPDVDTVKYALDHENNYHKELNDYLESISTSL